MSNPSAKVYTGQFDQFASAIVLDAVIFLAITLAFIILRLFKQNEFFFAPQYYDSKDRGNEQDLPELPKTPWGFVATVLRFPEERILRLRGLDSVMFLRIIKTCLIIFVLFIPFGVGILIPVDKTAHGGNTGIPEISLTNIPQQSGRLWAHTAVEIIFTFIALYVLYREYNRYQTLRIQWMKNEEAHNYTVMFKGNSTATLRTTSPTQYFSQLFPNNNVLDAHYVAKDHNLYKLIDDREKALEKLAFARACLDSTGKRPQHRVKPLIGKKVDSIEHYDSLVVAYNRQIEEYYARFLQNPTYAQVAFATFGSISEAAAICKTALDNGVKAVPAPQQSDVFWQQLSRAQSVSRVTRALTWVIIFALIFLWAIPIVFIQGIANLQNLSTVKGFHWLNGVMNWSPIAQGIIQQFLPSLFTIIFLALVPKIITVIVKKFRGVYTKSHLDRLVGKIYFFFLLFNVFLVTMWSGGIFSVIQNISNESGWDLIQALGSGVAAQAIFFINYILTYALFKYPLNIARIGSFIKAVLLRKKCGSELERRNMERPKEFPFGKSLAVLLLMFVIGFAYAPMSGFVLPFIMAFFAIAYVICKYMVVYVYYPRWDSGGLYWPLSFNIMCGSMILGHVILIGIFILRKTAATVLIGPLPFITLAFMLWARSKFGSRCKVLADADYPREGGMNGAAFIGAYTDPIETNVGQLAADPEAGKKKQALPEQNYMQPSSARM